MEGDDKRTSLLGLVHRSAHDRHRDKRRTRSKADRLCVGAQRAGVAWEQLPNLARDWELWRLRADRHAAMEENRRRSQSIGDDAHRGVRSAARHATCL
ncbi:MAG: hypothetical protein F2694_11400 [Actinobacteria bacterium]|nr:hypothetical protein [Actinomycetota bacterium]